LNLFLLDLLHQFKVLAHNFPLFSLG